MKTSILITSVGPNTIQRKDSEALSLYYTILFEKYGLNFYSSIMINHISDNFEEIILREGKSISINIKWPIEYQLDQIDERKRNEIRLDVVHEALKRISEKERKIDLHLLVTIKKLILESNFSFEYAYKKIVLSNSGEVNFIVKPLEKSFDYYIEFKLGKIRKCNIFLFSGLTSMTYLKDLFHNIEISQKKIIIVDKHNECEFRIDLETCSYSLINKSKFNEPLLFLLVKANVREDIRQQAYDQYVDLYFNRSN